jgi:hypothetical protein
MEPRMKIVYNIAAGIWIARVPLPPILTKLL